MTPGVDHLPYRLLGASGRARLQQRLETAVRRWLDAWVGTDAGAPSVRLASAAKPLAGAGREPLAEAYRVSAAGTTVLDIRVHPNALGAIVGSPVERFSANASLPRAGGLTARLSNALLRGLVNELMDSASIADWSLDEVGKRPAAAPSGNAPQSAIVHSGERELVALDLSPLLVNALVPLAAVQTKRRYEPCRGAIGDARVKVTAVLGQVELSVPEFMSLDRGDVVVLTSRIGESCRIEIPEVAAVAEATVGKRGRQRAIRIRRTDLRHS